MKLSGRENAIYRPLAKRAWQAYQAAGGQFPYDPWYRGELVATVGVYTTKEIKDKEDLEALCLRFSIIIGDDEQIDYWSRAPERRALWQLNRTMKNAGVNYAYVGAVAKKMGYFKPDGGVLIEQALQELPAELILKINTAIYLYWKRQTRKAVTR